MITRSSSMVTLARPPTRSSLKITNRSFRYAALCLGYRAFSLPGQFAPRIGPWPIRSLELSLPGLLAPWPIRSLALSLPGHFAPGNESSIELSFPGAIALSMCLSPCTFAVVHLHSRPKLNTKLRSKK